MFNMGSETMLSSAIGVMIHVFKHQSAPTQGRSQCSFSLSFRRLIKTSTEAPGRSDNLAAVELST